MVNERSWQVRRLTDVVCCRSKVVGPPSSNPQISERYCTRRTLDVRNRPSECGLSISFSRRELPVDAWLQRLLSNILMLMPLDASRSRCERA